MFLDEPFLQSILDHPDDDAPRLVYADWLEERGETARAELIRLQCTAGDSQREQDLLARHAADWAGPAFRHVFGIAFRRGFVAEVTLEARLFLNNGEQLFASAPVQLVRLIGARNVLCQLVRSPLLGRLRALHLTGCQVGDDGVDLLAECDYLKDLRTLRLGVNAVSDRGVESLCSSRYLANLNTLVLRGNLVGDLGARLLASCERLPNLQTLDLSQNLLGDAGAEALARSPFLTRLTGLDLADQIKNRSQILRGVSYPIQPNQQRALMDRFGLKPSDF
jgi:uncharacterized protein (TIGR02996 family)